jgi:hypothetical protein
MWVGSSKLPCVRYWGCRYDRHGPYDILIDGANVAYYGQNRQGGGFDWHQIRRMVEAVRAAHPQAKVLLVRGGGRAGPVVPVDTMFQTLVVKAF